MTEQLLLDLAKGKLGFGDKAYILCFKQLNPDLEYEPDLDIVYCRLAEEYHLLLKKYKSDYDLGSVIFNELRIGYIFPENINFHKLLFEILKNKIIYYKIKIYV